MLDIRALRSHEELRRMIVSNVPLVDVAAFIQDEQHEALDLQRESLIRALARYRDTIPPLEFVEARGRPGTGANVISKAKAALVDGIDELSELNRIYLLHISRVEKLKAQEDKFPTVNFPGLTQDVRVAVEIVMARAKLKQDLGLTPHHLGTAEVDLNVQVQQSIEAQPPLVQKALRNPESVHRVLAILARAGSLAELERRKAPAVEPVVVSEQRSGG